jgi:hypothetical protein
MLKLQLHRTYGQAIEAVIIQSLRQMVDEAALDSRLDFDGRWPG